MGSCISKAYDLYEDYRLLCKRYDVVSSLMDGDFWYDHFITLKKRKEDEV